MNLNNHYEILDVLFKELPFMFWKNTEGRYLGVNENQAKEFGLTREDIIGKTIFEILEDYDSAQQINDTDNEIMRSGEKKILKETIIKANGEFTYLSQKYPIFDKNGVVIGLIGLSLDVTHSKNQVNHLDDKIIEQETFKQCLDNIQNTIQSFKFSMLNRLIGVNSVTSSEDISLSKREQEIVYLLSLGKQSKEIADILSKLDSKSISASTVSGIINKRLYRKLGVSNLGKLLEKAYALELIPFMPDTFLVS